MQCAPVTSPTIHAGMTSVINMVSMSLLRPIRRATALAIRAILRQRKKTLACLFSNATSTM